MISVMSDPGQKVRVPNFSNTEKINLMRIISNKYANILEDKKTDRTSTLQKQKAWKDIEREFNASSSCTTYRSFTSLKKCYENRKKELRKTLAARKKETMLTGGGPPPQIKTDPTDDILLSILNEKTLVGLNNPFDDDANENLIEYQHNDTIIEYMVESDEEPLPTTSASPLEVEEDISWQKCTPKKLQIPLGSAVANNKAPQTAPLEVEENICWKKSTPKDVQKPLGSAVANNKSPQTAPLEVEENISWQKCTPKDLQKPVSSAIANNKTPQKSRRRPSTIVKALTTSDMSKKYDLLLDKRLQILDLQLAHMHAEHTLVTKKQKLEIEILEMELSEKRNK